MAVFSAYLLNKYLKLNCKSYFVLEMPSYKIPMFKNVGINVLEKLKPLFWCWKNHFSLIRYFMVLGSHGLSDDFNNAEKS